MQDGCPEGGHAVDVRVHQQLIIEPQDRVVQHCGVKSDAQVRCAEDRPVPGQRVPNPGRESLTNTLFLTSRANLYGFRVTESNPYPDAVLAFLLNFLSPGRMRL